jgi:Protein of unknown function (DUF1236)
MRNHHNAALAGVAALALLAGTGLALAQTSQDQGGASKHPAAQQMNNGPSAGKTDQMNNGAPAGKTDQSSAASQQKTNQQVQTESNQKSAATNTGNKVGNGSTIHRHLTQSQIRQRRIAAQRTTTRLSAQSSIRANVTAQHNGMHGSPGNASDMKGLQGNASGMAVRLNDEQRTQIRTTIVNAPNAPRVENVQFNVAAGTVIPRNGVRIVPVTPALVRIDAAWRGFRYFVWMDDVVIVNPRTMTIVAVVPV